MRRILATALIVSAGLWSVPVHGQLADLRGNKLEIFDDAKGQEAAGSLPSSAKLATVTIDQRFLYYVTQLDHPDYAVREEARQWLLNMARDKHQFYAILDREKLTQEQRWRMLAIASEHVISTPRGALGISMRSVAANGRPGIEIQVNELLPGLPAEQVLKVGDRITHVDGDPLMDQDDLPFRIQSKRPGEVLHLRVKRPKTDHEGNVQFDANNDPVNENLEIDVVLGSFDVLVKSGRPNQTFKMDLELKRETDALSLRYSPDVKSIGIHGDKDTFFSSRTNDGDDDSKAKVDRHAAIQALLRQRRMIDQGRIEPAAVKSMRTHWNNQLKALYQMAKDPKLSREDQLYLRKVIARYVELMKL